MQYTKDNKDQKKSNTPVVHVRKIGEISTVTMLRLQFKKNKMAKCRADIQVMHEFTDGCSAQYKSRNCMGDVSTRRSDLGYST